MLCLRKRDRRLRRATAFAVVVVADMIVIVVNFRLDHQAYKLESTTQSESVTDSQ